jgi:hypothetical protein
MKQFYHREKNGGLFLMEDAGQLIGLRNPWPCLWGDGFHVRRTSLTQLYAAFTLNA